MTKKITALFLILYLFSCSAPEKKTAVNDSLTTDTIATDTSTTGAITGKDTTAVAAKKSETKWTYSDEEDKMTSKKKYFASINANDLLEFDFPYDGGVTATLTIRRQGSSNEAILSVTKGQFITDLDGTNVKIRIDDGPATSYSASGPSDSSTEVLFINNANKLINKMKTAKKVLIQAEFYQSGNKVMEFDVDGFKWEH